MLSPTVYVESSVDVSFCPLKITSKRSPQRDESRVNDEHTHPRVALVARVKDFTTEEGITRNGEKSVLPNVG